MSEERLQSASMDEEVEAPLDELEVWEAAEDDGLGDAGYTLHCSHNG